MISNRQSSNLYDFVFLTISDVSRCRFVLKSVLVKILEIREQVWSMMMTSNDRRANLLLVASMYIDIFSQNI